MCEFVSFFVSVDKNRIICGDPRSHSDAPVHSGEDDWREAEWTEDGLTIRVTDDEDENAYEATVLAQAKSLKKLCLLLSPSKDLYGDKYWFNETGFHREGGPAIEWANGHKEWLFNGRLHRENGPAVECASGTKFWYLHGKLHREDGPAVEQADGRKEWWVDGKQHREDGPAIERANGSKE